MLSRVCALDASKSRSNWQRSGVGTSLFEGFRVGEAAVFEQSCAADAAAAAARETVQEDALRLAERGKREEARELEARATARLADQARVRIVADAERERREQLRLCEAEQRRAAERASRTADARGVAALDAARVSRVSPALFPHDAGESQTRQRGRLENAER